MKELNLFIIWNTARYLEDKILNDISHKFEIIQTFDINWSEEHFADNLSRFYGKKLAKASRKMEKCGTGNFLLAVVYDHNPKHKDGRNTNISKAKDKYRQWTGGGHLIHGSDDMAETEENLMFLLGTSCNDFAEKYANAIWNKEHQTIKRDVTGSPEWKTEHDLLSFAEKLPETSISRIQDTHLITTNDISKVCRLLNATKRLFFLKRNMYQVPVSGGNKFIYIRKPA